MRAFISQVSGSLASINEHCRNTAFTAMGIRVVAAGPDFLVAEMPVDERTRQPYGLLHGGASIVLAESLGSLASGLLVRSKGGQPAGIEVGGSHLRRVDSGRVTGTCRPVKIGRSLHFWRIEIRDGTGELCCSAHLTVHIRWPPQEGVTD